METLHNHQPSRTEMMTKYLRLWPMLLISLLLCVLTGYLYLQTQVSLYKVTSTLLLQDDAKGDGLFKGTAFSDLNLFNTPKTVDDEMEVLRSRDLIYKVFRELNLQVNYSYSHFMKNEELYGKTSPVIIETIALRPGAYATVLNIKAIDQERFQLSENGISTIFNYGSVISRPAFKIIVRRGAAQFRPDKPVQVTFSDLYRKAQAYSAAGLIVMPVIKDANTVVITIMDALPERGEAILNTLLTLYNSENIKSKNRIALQTISFINSKLKTLTANLSGAERDIENYKIKNRITELNEDAQINLQSSGVFSEQLAAANVQLRVINTITAYLRSGKDQFALVPASLGIKDPTFEGLIEKYNTLRVERQRLLRNNTTLNPLVIALTEQLMGLRTALLENLRVIKRGILLERANLSNQTYKSQNRLSSVPVMERGLLERSREQGVKTTQYQYLLQKREETELSLSATIPSFKIVETPGYDPNPASPKVQLVYLISMLGGVSLPIGIVFVRGSLNRKVREATDATYITEKGNILGELSHKVPGDTIVVEKGKSTNISELFKYIRANIQSMGGDKMNKVMLVTSTSQGEGKTFFSINLGITLSLIGKKVVILEFDLRNPNLLSDMKLSSSLGLSDYLSDHEVNIDELLVPVPDADNLWVIGCGKIPDNPSELLSSPRLSTLLATLREQFDYIILDSSPVGLVSDAFTLGQFVDVSIYMVRYNFTNKEELSVFTDISENKRLKNPMIVFNDAKKENKNRYRYGSYAYN